MATLAKGSLELINALQGLRISAYVDIGSFAILVYDYMLTFEDERTLIWHSKWSLTKVLFLMTRYLPFIDLSVTTSRHFRTGMTPEACLHNYKIGGLLIDIGIIIAELIVALRTWAIWERKRNITIIILVWIIINLASDFVFAGLYFESIEFASLPAGLSGCIVTSGNSLLVGSWVILMIYEAGILGLVVLKGIQMYKEYVDKELQDSTLYKVVFRNGAIFYIYIFILSVANVIVISRLPRDLSALLASIERVTHAILTERLLLTLRRAIYEPEPEQTYRLETMEFDESTRVVVDTETEIGLTPS